MAAVSALIQPSALIAPAPLFWAAPVVLESSHRQVGSRGLRGVALHVEDFGFHAFTFLFLPIKHTSFKVLILLGVGLSDAAPAVEPLHSFEVLNLVVLIEERNTEYEEDSDKYCYNDF